MWQVVAMAAVDNLDHTPSASQTDDPPVTTSLNTYYYKHLEIQYTVFYYIQYYCVTIIVILQISGPTVYTSWYLGATQYPRGVWCPKVRYNNDIWILDTLVLQRRIHQKLKSRLIQYHSVLFVCLTPHNYIRWWDVLCILSFTPAEAAPAEAPKDGVTA